MNLLPRIEDLEARVRAKFPEAVVQRGPNLEWLHIVLRIKETKSPIMDVASGCMILSEFYEFIKSGEQIVYAQSSSNLIACTYSISIRFKES